MNDNFFGSVGHLDLLFAIRTGSSLASKFIANLETLQTTWTGDLNRHE